MLHIGRYLQVAWTVMQGKGSDFKDIQPTIQLWIFFKFYTI